MKSIKSYLLKSLMTILLIVTLLVSIIAYMGSMHEMNELFDEHLKQMAVVLQKQDFLASQTILPSSKNESDHIRDEEDFLIQIWNKKILQYSSYPGVHFPLQDIDGFKTISYQDNAWRSYTIRDGDEIIQVSQPLIGRSEMVAEIGLNMLIPILLQLPVLTFFIWFTIKKGLRPLNTISSAIYQRTPSSLQPIDLAYIPEEIQSLVQSLNNLLVRLEDALNVQKKFTADAAHELRTPLTAIQLQLAILMRAKDDAERTRSMTKLEKGIKRCIHLAQQLLSSARLEAHELSVHMIPVNLYALASDHIDHLQALAASKNINVTIDGHASALIQGYPDKLQTLINNLLDNAIRYTPEHGHVHVSVKQDHQKITLSVADDGPGIPPNEYERVFDRFYRILGTKTSGTGLGLSIVKMIAQQHNANITLDQGLDQKGLTVSVHFPVT